MKGWTDTLEDLPYSYYNVAWSDKVVMLNSAKQILDTVKGKGAERLGIVTGEPRKDSENRLGQDWPFFILELGAYAEAGYSAREIVGKAVDKILGSSGTLWTTVS